MFEISDTVDDFSRGLLYNLKLQFGEEVTARALTPKLFEQARLAATDAAIKTVWREMAAVRRRLDLLTMASALLKGKNEDGDRLLEELRKNLLD